jgi:serine/threonine-protein kinase
MGASATVRRPDAGDARDIAGKYRLFASLGSGGMADVYLAEAHGPMGFNKLVVVKTLRSTVVDDPEMLAMFLDEAKLAARLTHANIVHTYEVSEHEGGYFIAMEYLEGQPLHRILARAKSTGTPIPEAVSLRIVCDALAGLEYAHDARDYDGTPLSVVHRDVSPHNIFVTYAGDVKILDFGIAKAALNSKATADGVVKGKIHYMSPEQALSEAIDRRADVYAAGGVLWELLAGECALEGGLPLAFSTLTTGQIRDLREVAPHVSAELDAIVKHAMALDAKERTPTAEAFRSELVVYASKKADGIASNRSVADFMAPLFEDDRSEIKRRISEHLATPRSGSFGSRSLMVLAHDSSRSMPTGSSVSRPSNVASDAAGSSMPTLSAEPPPRRRRWLLFGAIALALSATGYAYVRSAARTAAPPAVASPALSQAPAPSPTAKASERVELSLHATPPTAALLVDGVDVGQNPYRADVPKDDALHEIRAAAPGYAPRAITISFDRDVNVELALVLAAPSASAERPAPASPRPPRHAAQPVPSASAEPPFKMRTER